MEGRDRDGAGGTEQARAAMTKKENPRVWPGVKSVREGTWGQRWPPPFRKYWCSRPTVNHGPMVNHGPTARLKISIDATTWVGIQYASNEVPRPIIMYRQVPSRPQAWLALALPARLGIVRVKSMGTPCPQSSDHYSPVI